MISQIVCYLVFNSHKLSRFRKSSAYGANSQPSKTAAEGNFSVGSFGVQPQAGLFGWGRRGSQNKPRHGPGGAGID